MPAGVGGKPVGSEPVQCLLAGIGSPVEHTDLRVMPRSLWDMLEHVSNLEVGASVYLHALDCS